MLIDDNPDDNFFHERVIKKCGAADIVVTRETGKEALEYLMDEKQNGGIAPDVIFLDINMPGMNGWEFLEAYNKLDIQYQGRVMIVMLTTSDNTDDKSKATGEFGVSNFRTKPLTKEYLEEVLQQLPDK